MFRKLKDRLLRSNASKAKLLTKRVQCDNNKEKETAIKPSGYSPYGGEEPTRTELCKADQAKKQERRGAV